MGEILSVREFREGEKHSLNVKFDKEKMKTLYTSVDFGVLDTLKSLPDEITFEVGTTLIIGPNGSGKTILLKAIEMAIRLRMEGGNIEDIEEDNQWSVLNRVPGTENIHVVADIAKCISVDMVFDPENVYYFDATLSNPKVAQAQNTFDEDGRQNVVAQAVSFMNSSGSLREKKNGIIDELTQKAENSEGTSVVIIDEFENGLDPRRHRKIIEKLERIQAGTNIVIIATNSPILEERSDIPRIDLLVPEVGITSRKQLEISDEEFEERDNFLLEKKNFSVKLKRLLHDLKEDMSHFMPQFLNNYFSDKIARVHGKYLEECAIFEDEVRKEGPPKKFAAILTPIAWEKLIKKTAAERAAKSVTSYNSFGLFVSSLTNFETNVDIKLLSQQSVSDIFRDLGQSKVQLFEIQVSTHQLDGPILKYGTIWVSRAEDGTVQPTLDISHPM